MACLHLVSLQGICDGAGAVVLSSEAAITQHGLKPLARLVDYSVTGVDPTIMGIGPAYAIRMLLQRNNLSLSDIELVEVLQCFIEWQEGGKGGRRLSQNCQYKNAVCTSPNHDYINLMVNKINSGRDWVLGYSLPPNSYEFYVVMLSAQKLTATCTQTATAGKS